MGLRGRAAELAIVGIRQMPKWTNVELRFLGGFGGRRGTASSHVKLRDLLLQEFQWLEHGDDYGRRPTSRSDMWNTFHLLVPAMPARHYRAP